MWALWLLGLAVAAYSTSLDGDLLRDDIPCIRDNADIRPSAPLLQPFQNDYWGTPIAHNHSHKSYRPLVVLTFRANYSLHGLWAPGYRWSNLALHVAAAFALHSLFVRLGMRTRAAQAAALLFAVHPANSEAVMSVVGRADVMATLCFLAVATLHSRSLSALLWSDRRTPRAKDTAWAVFGHCAGCVATWMAILVKETCITYFAVAAAAEVVAAAYRLCGAAHVPRHGASGEPSCDSAPRPPHRPSAARVALVHGLRVGHCAVHAASALWFSRWVRGPMFSPGFSYDTNPVAFAEPATRARTYAVLHALYTHRLVLPVHLCAEYAHRVFPVVDSWADGRLLAVASHALLLCYLAWNALAPSSPLARLAARAAAAAPKGGPATWLPPLRPGTHARCLFGLCLLTGQLPLAPALGVGVNAGTVFAERLLHLPCLAACVAAAQVGDMLLLALPHSRGEPPGAGRGRKAAGAGAWRWAEALFPALLLLATARTAARGPAWRNIDSLLKDTLVYRNTSISSLHGLAMGRVDAIATQLREAEDACRLPLGVGPAQEGARMHPDAQAAAPCVADRAARASELLRGSKEMLVRALRVWPEWGTGFIELARIALLEDRRGIAMRLLEHGCALSSPRRLRAAGLRELAILNIREEKYARAAYALSVATKLQPQEPQAWYLTGHAEFELHSTAVAAGSRGAEAEEAERGESSGGIRAAHLDRAIEAMRRAVALAPDDTRYQRDLAVMLATGRAMSGHGHQRAADAGEGPTREVRATISGLTAKDLEEPLRLLERVLRLDPGDQLARQNFAQISRAYQRRKALERRPRAGAEYRAASGMQTPHRRAETFGG